MAVSTLSAPAGTSSRVHRSVPSHRPDDEQDVPEGLRSRIAVPGSPEDTPGDLLREAWRPGTAEPVDIHVRPELCARLLRSRRTRPRSRPAPGPFPPRRIPLVVDEQIPAAPGFEVHRVPPGAGGSGPELLDRQTHAPGAAREPLLVLEPSGDCSCTVDPPARAGEADDPHADRPMQLAGRVEERAPR